MISRIHDALIPPACAAIAIVCAVFFTLATAVNVWRMF
jgi:hypothetical protein